MVRSGREELDTKKEENECEKENKKFCICMRRVCVCAVVSV